MYNAFTGLAASSARTRQQRCSQVSNNEASVFHRQTLIRAKMLSPHAIVVDPGVDSRQRSLRIRFPWTSAVDYYGMSTTRILLDATYTWRWLCKLIYLSSSRPSRCELGIEKNALLVQARGATQLLSSSSLRNIAHAANFGRNETLIDAWS